jgi:aspartokinase
MPDDNVIQRLHDIARWLSRASSTQEDATAVIEAIDLIERLRAREAEAAAIIADAVLNHDAMEAEIALLKKENDAAWDAIKVLGDYLTSEEISEELKRRGFDAAKAFARIKVVLRAKKGEGPWS